MATLGQALKKVAFEINKPLVKLTAGGKVDLSTEEAKRLPPGQFATDRFATLHRESSFPTQQDIQHWTLTIDGEVENPIKLTLDEIKKLPATEQFSDFHCVTSWTRFDNKWKGVPVKELLAMAKVKPGGWFVTQTAWSGHTTSTPIEELMGDDVLVAYEQEGKPLTQEHGAPLRIILPKKYAYKGVKWLTKLTITRKEELGYWEQNGYSQTADPWNNDRYS